MDKRLVQLFKVLISHADFVSTEYLCEVLDISSRTLRTEMSRLSECLAETGTELEKKRNLGVRLKVVDTEKLKLYKKKIDQTNIPTTQEERIEFIIRSLFKTSNFVNINWLLEQLHISRSTFHTDLKLVKAQISQHRLTLMRRGGAEIKIGGKEQDIRLYIACSPELQRGLEEEQKTAEKILYQVLKRHQYRLTDPGFQRVAMYISAAVIRVRCGAAIPADESDSHVNMTELQIGKDITELLERRYCLHFAKTESIGIAIVLLGSRSSLNIGTEISTETNSLVQEIFERISSVYGINFSTDSELFIAIAPHIQAMLDRVKYGQFIKNPLLMDIKIKYQLAFDMSFTAGEYISGYLGLQIDEGELSFLALYFQLALERRRERKKQRVLVVCASNGGSSQLLLYRLRESFGEYLDEIRVSPSNEVDEDLTQNYDCIITTVPLKVKTPVPILQINYFLEESNLTLIRKFLENNHSEYGFVQKCFEKSFIFDNICQSTKEGVIKEIIQRVKPYRSLPDNFEELVLLRESIAPTEYGNMMALPHPTQICMDETFIAIAFLPVPIRWVNTEVKTVIVLFIQKNVDSGVQLFNEILSKLILNRKSMLLITQNPNFSTLLHEVAKLCSVQDLDTSQSFFW